MTASIFSGELEVLESGSVLITKDSPLIIKLGADPEFKFSFYFEKNSNSERSMKGTAIDKTELKFDLINFDDPLGCGLLEPVSIGTYKNRKLFLFFETSRMSEKSGRLFHYTFFLGDKAS